MPLAGGKRSATTGGSWRESQKRMERRGRTPQNVRFRYQIRRQRRKKASIPLPHRAGTVPGFLSNHEDWLKNTFSFWRIIRIEPFRCFVIMALHGDITPNDSKASEPHLDRLVRRSRRT